MFYFFVTGQMGVRPITAAQSMNTETKQKWVGYYRVSTQRQGESGLGLEAQRDSVERFVQQRGGELLASYTETESGKKASNRPELQHALELCLKQRATLIISKLDRLARNVHFISGLLESKVEFIAVDQPTKDRFIMHIFGAFAEEEARRISVRTKEALAAAKRRGVEIGATGKARATELKKAAAEKAESYRPLMLELLASGFTEYRALRDELNRRGVPSPGGGRWHLPNVFRLYRRLTGAPTPARPQS